MIQLIIAIALLPVVWMLLFGTPSWKSKLFALLVASMMGVLLAAVWFSPISMVLASVLSIISSYLLTKWSTKPFQAAILANMKAHYLAWLVATLILSTYEIMLNVNVFQLSQRPMILFNIGLSTLIIYAVTQMSLRKILHAEAWSFFIERVTAPQIVSALVVVIIKNSSLFFILTLSRHAQFVTLLFWLVTFSELIFVIITVFYIHTSYRFSIVNYRHEILYQTYDLQVEHLQQLEQKSQALRKITHDIQNHHLVLHELLQTGAIERAQTYLHEFEKFRQDERDAEHEFTAHGVMNALLNQKLKICQQHQIRPQFIVEIDTIPLSDFDVCVILGNLLDNAIEATQQVDIVQRQLKFQAKYVNDNLIFMIENPFVGELSLAGEVIQTTKVDAIWHGIGLKNVQQIIMENAGEFVYHASDGQFQVLVRIPLISEDEHKLSKQN